MQGDNKPRQDDDDFLDAEDMDFDDLPAEADIVPEVEDESWDDPADTEAGDSKTTSAKSAGNTTKKPGKKGGRKFLLLVASVAVIGGLGIFAAKFIAPPASEQASLPAEEENVSGMREVPEEASPPMPAPIEQPAPAPSGEVLTPLPEPQELTQNMELPDLDAPAAPAPGEQPENILPPPAVVPPPTAPETHVPEVKAGITQEALVPPAGIEQAPAAPAEFAPAVPPESDAAATAKLAELEGQVSTLKEAVTQKDTKISELSDEIAELKKQLAKKSAATGAAAAQSSQKKSAPAESPRSLVESKPRAEKPAKVAAEKSMVSTRKWQLRSAQPGKAVLAAADTGDLRSVEVGDTLPGLGRIKSIALEGGTWVIKGTQGQITR
ncbi:MAG: hypothetical protein IT558_01955 [Alphaproteobacteria bacterium]|nr:hypothetical protein [Alphaproteobacteria bacterium]